MDQCKSVAQGLGTPGLECRGAGREAHVWLVFFRWREKEGAAEERYRAGQGGRDERRKCKSATATIYWVLIVSSRLNAEPIVLFNSCHNFPSGESNSPLSPLSANYSSPLWAAEHLCCSPDLFSEQRQSKHRRFQNTLVVLHKSGLLEITLNGSKPLFVETMAYVQVESGEANGWHFLICW